MMGGSFCSAVWSPCWSSISSWVISRKLRPKLEGEFPSAVHPVTFDLFQLGGLAAYQLAPPLDVFQNVWLFPDADQEPAPHDCIQGIEEAEDALGRPFLLIFCRGDCERIGAA